MKKRLKCSWMVLVLILLLSACGPKPPAPEPDPVPPPPKEADLPLKAPTPDPVGFLTQDYPPMPVLHSQEEVSRYFLWNLLQGKYDMEFYLDRALGDDWDAYCLMDEAHESTKTYNLFGAYNVEEMRSEDRGDEEGLYAHFSVEYINPAYDEEAREAAWAWVRKNPPPRGGFTDFETERAYAQSIHDYLARKVTYNPLGDDQDFMNETYDYDAFQEAYNVLGQGQESAVCSGYARSFALIAQYAGINAVWVRGNHEENGASHAWNILYPCDGSEPVTIDVTWDDTDSVDEPGQTEVLDDWFYLPVSQDGSHIIEDRMIQFLDQVNDPDLTYVPTGAEDAVG